MTRRKFLRIAGSTLAIAALPLGSRVLRAAKPRTAEFGGPTANGDFYVTSYSSTPTVDPNSWRLRIKGLVANPMELSLTQLRSLPELHERGTMECISNAPNGDAISTADWIGANVKPLLERAKVSPKAAYVAMRGADGYHTGAPIDEILRDDNYFAYKMNGTPLPAAHGFPVRIIIPGKYGMKQPKWITEIEFLDHEYAGYWETRGWSKSAWRKVNSGFFSPRVEGGLLDIFDRNAKVSGPTDIWGWALAGPAGVRRVEVSTDDGRSWHDAEIVENRGYNVWTVWKHHFAPVKAGDYVIRVRATDGKGHVQPVTDPQTGSGMGGQPAMGITVVRT
ncbi:MAG: molybdopterin-dependent oxidoreductase [Candidatus Binataceae bacterium]